jgi:8-oxo-dGTP diphosphatase
VIENPRGTFLPGGGGEPGETPEVTVRREVREECGYEVIELVRLGEAVQYVFTAGNAHGLSKHGVFFDARLGRRLGDPTEAEDRLNWVEPAVAVRALTLESQAWVVERCVAGSSRASGPRGE